MPEEESIDLVDLFFFLAKKWRGILIAVLIGAVLGGGLFFVQRSRAAKAVDMEAFQEALEEYEELKDIFSGRLENSQNAFDNLLTYVSESVLMSVDPNKIPTAEVILHIDLKTGGKDTSPSDSADEVVSAYAAAANTAIDWSELPQAKTDYTNELVTVEKDYLGNNIIVSVVYSDLKTASALADGIAAQIISWSDTYQSVAPHTIAVLSSAAAHESDPELLKIQKDVQNTLREYKSNTIIAQGELDALQEPSLVGGGSKKLAAVVCIGCVFCYGAFLVAAYLFSGTVHTEADVADAYGISLIGKFYPDHKKSWPDRLLNKWQYGRVSESDEAVCSRIVSNVRNLNKGGKILLTGGTSDASLNVLAEKLRAQLPETEFDTGASVARDSATLAKINQADSVILVEQAGISRRAAVRQEILSIAGISKPILGVVFLSEGKQLN